MIGDSGRNRNGMDSAEKLLHHSSAAARSACVARGGGVSAEGECASERASMERYDLVFRDRVPKGRGGGNERSRQKMLILSTHHEDLSVLSRYGAK